MMGEVSVKIELKVINFRADYVLLFLRILAFSVNYNPREISQNFPSVKFNLCKISEKISEK